MRSQIVEVNLAALCWERLYQSLLSQN